MTELWEHLGAIVAAVALISNVTAVVVGMAVRNAMLTTKAELLRTISDQERETEKKIDDKLERVCRDFPNLFRPRCRERGNSPTPLPLIVEAPK